jgi:hypothetical protein
MTKRKRTLKEKQMLYEWDCPPIKERSMGYSMEEVSPNIRKMAKNLAQGLDILEEHAYALMIEKIKP